jgi:Sulfotransferase family
MTMTTPPCESPYADRMIEVLGTVRSGTTWLVELLGAHPDVGTTPGESWIFNSLRDLWGNVHSSDDGPSAYMDRGEIVAAMRRFCDGLFAGAAARQAPGTSWFVEKTPGHSRRIPLMAAVYPDGWYIHIIRDGRDVVRSLTSTSWGYDNPGDAATAWVSSVRDTLDNCWRLARYRELRYEDLLVDPVGQVKALLEWMGLEVDADVEHGIAERAEREVSRFAATDPVGAGKWRDLPADVLDKVHEEAGDLLMELGYLSPPSPSAGSA